MILLCLDPGTAQTAFVVWDTELDDFTGVHYRMGLPDNSVLIDKLPEILAERKVDKVAIEMIQSYGMALGKSSFITMLFIGRVMQVIDGFCDYALYGRPTIKGWLGGKTDAQIRASLRERHGDAKKGEKLEGVKKDIWSALALAVALTENPKLKEW